jgi:hypothetical protein
MPLLSTPQTRLLRISASRKRAVTNTAVTRRNTTAPRRNTTATSTTTRLTQHVDFRARLEQLAHFKNVEVRREDLIKVAIRLESAKIFLDVESSSDLRRHTIRAKLASKTATRDVVIGVGSLCADVQMT